MAGPLTKSVICPVLIGRAPELETLHLLIDRAKSGVGQVALICGEAGIGKSRLVAGVITSAANQGFHLLPGHCFETDRSVPYAPLLDLLRRYFARYAKVSLPAEVEQLAQEVPCLLPELPLLLPHLAFSPSLPMPDPEHEKHRRFAVLTHFFTQQASHHPMLVIVEDLHWSDAIGLEFLLHLARRSKRLPLLLILAYRSEEMSSHLEHWLAQWDREHLAQDISLERLSRPEVDAMLHAIFARQPILPVELVETIYTLTEGNPFFIEEVLKALLTSGGITFTESGQMRMLPPDAPGSHFHIPRSVLDAVHQRTRRLSTKARQLVNLAAVAGRRFDVAVLQHLLHCDASQMMLLLKEVMAAQLVVEESADQFSFRHELTRQAIYAELLVRERQVLHRSIADTIEYLSSSPSALDAHLADLAYHSYEGEVWARALEYGQRAGEKALAFYAPRAAVEHLTRAVEAASHLTQPPAASLYRARGQAYEILGRFEQARADYERALAIAQETHDGPMEWQSLSDLGFLWANRDYTQANQWFRRALDLAQVLTDPRLQASSLDHLGNWLANTGHVEESLPAHRQTLSMFELLIESPLQHPALLLHLQQQALKIFETQNGTWRMAETLELLGIANCIYGDLVTAERQYGQAIDLFRAMGDIRSLISCLTFRALYSSPMVAESTFSPLRTRDECVNDALEALQLAREANSPVAQALVKFNIGLILASFGEFGPALAYIQKSRRIGSEIEHQQWAVGADFSLGVVYLLMLEPTLAVQALERALPLARELGSAWWSTIITTHLARTYLLKNELPCAEAALAAVFPREQRPRNLRERLMSRLWGELALRQGQPNVALRIAENLLEAVPGATDVQSRQPIPWLLKLKGQALIALGHPDEALPVLEEAKRGALERQERSLQWYLHGIIGRAHHDLKQEEEARREWLAARNLIASLAATIDEPALRRKFSNAALSMFWPKEKLPHTEAEQFGGLTEREREVARLIAQGKSNQAIAEELAIARRTIETHVSNILYKLGFTSRTQIAAWAVDRGLAKTRD